MFKFSGRATPSQFLIGSAVRCLLVAAGFWISMFVLMGDCYGPSCGAGFAGFLYLHIIAASILALSMIGLTVRRSRDAGWPPLAGAGLLAGMSIAPLLVLVPGLAWIAMPLLLPLVMVPFAHLVPGLHILVVMTLIMCPLPSNLHVPERLRNASNRPPRIG